MVSLAKRLSFGFSSFAEFTVFMTFVFLGMSIMMVISAITSAPDFVEKYYEYATGIPDVECEKPFFWDNANTFFNVGTYVMQVIMEPMALTTFIRKIPLQLRLYCGLIIMFLEMLLLIIVPSITIPTQDGAIAVLMVVSVMGGFSKALVDSTTNALVGPFPTKFMNGELWGLTVVALFMSIVQCILKGTMSSGFTSGLNQSRIYLAIGMFIQFIAIGLLAIMPRNPFAQKYAAEYRVKAQGGAVADESEGERMNKITGEPAAAVETNDIEPIDREDDLGAFHHSESVDPANEDGADAGAAATGERRSSVPPGPAEGEIRLNDSDPNIKHDPLRPSGEDSDEVRAVDSDNRTGFLSAKGDADKMVDLDQQGNLTSTDQMLRTSVSSVIRRVWPMLCSAFLVFFTSLFLFPGIFFKVPNDSDWYGTIVVLLFNAGDFISRLVLMVPRLRPSPRVVISGACARLIIVPLLVVCARGLVPGVALPYVLVGFLGLTNGYFGTMAMIHCPRTPALKTAGERSIAAIWAGIFLMLGLCFGSNLALAVTLTWKDA